MKIDCYILDKQINFDFRNVRNKMNVAAYVCLIYDVINDDIVLLKQHGLFSDQSTGIFTDVACIPSYKTTGYTIILKHIDQINTVYLHVQPIQTLSFTL